MFRLGIPELIVLCVMALSFAVLVYPATRICLRLGFTPWLGVLIVVPLANSVLCFQLNANFPSWTSWVRSPSSALCFQELGAAPIPAVSANFEIRKNAVACGFSR